MFQKFFFNPKGNELGWLIAMERENEDEAKLR
jgi:hypothetical protein